MAIFINLPIIFFLNFHNGIVSMQVREYVQQNKQIQYEEKILSKLIIKQVYNIVGYAKQKVIVKVLFRDIKRGEIRRMKGLRVDSPLSIRINIYSLRKQSYRNS